MRKTLGWGVAILMVCGVVSTAFCAEPVAKTDKSTKTGIVKKVDVDGKKIVVMVARELTFSVTADTQIVKGDAAKTLADIKEGDSVTVDYTRADKDTRVASKIAIAGPVAPDASATPANPAPAK